MGDKIEVQNVNVPGQVNRVSTIKYQPMRAALLKVLPSTAPGMTYEQMLAAVKPLLPDAQFPGGKTSGWWLKTVQLDLEAKGLMHRSESRPLTWWQGKASVLACG